MTIQLQEINKQHIFKNEMKIYNNIHNRQYISWLIRLRTRYYDFNNYLHHFGIEEESICECEKDNEIIAHFLLRYEIFARQRKKLIKEVKTREMRVEELLEDSKRVKYILQYIKETNRFPF